MDDVMGTAEAARRLQVSPQRVRALWHEGALSGRIVANRLLLDPASVLDLAERDRPASRPLSVRNAWTMLMMLAGEPAPWASAAELSRLRRLLSTRDAEALAVLVRSRARTSRFDGVPGVERYVQRNEHVVPTGATLAHRWSDLVADHTTEVYAAESVARSLTTHLRLWADPQGPIVIHAVPDDLGNLLRDRTEMPAPVVAVDLIYSSDPRSHRAGEALWSQSVHQWRDQAGVGWAQRRDEAP